MDINLLREALVPGSVEGQFIWDLVLYVIIFFQFITLLMVFTGSLRDLILMGATFICGIADKLYLFGFVEGDMQTLNGAADYHLDVSFLTWGTRVAMFALPLIMATQTKIKSARGTGIFLFIITIVYAFARWFFQQSGLI